MAHFDEHCNDCERLLGNRCEEVNRWMDEGFKKYGANHRFWRHHRRGVALAGKEFGSLGRLAAMVHVLRDCGRIPLPMEYDPVKREAAPLIITPEEGLIGVWLSMEQFDSAAYKLLALDEVERG